MAIGSGGLTGKASDRLGRSATLAICRRIAQTSSSPTPEKVGFVGSLVVLILFFLLVWRVLHAATVSRDRFGVLIAVGVATMLTFHALINVGMAMGMMPVTGLPLPFV